MYGGVATPLALLHQSDFSERPPPKHHNAKRPPHRDDNFNGTRNVPRLPPLRETNHRDRDQGASNNCENDPLLPTPPKPGWNVKGKFAIEENLPLPPLPPHKNHYQPVMVGIEINKYTKIWNTITCFYQYY